MPGRSRSRVDILDTARAILTLARSGATEGERDAALHRLAAYIRKHKITQAELDRLDASSQFREEGISLPSNEKWRKTLASVIGGHFDCRVLSAFRQVYFVGTPGARADAITMYQHVLPQAVRLHDTVAPRRMEQLKLRHRNVYRVGFYMGFCKGLNDRLETIRAAEAHNGQKRLGAAEPSQGDVEVATALAVVEHALAEFHGQPTDEDLDRMYQQRIRPDPWQPPRDVSGEAFRDGHTAARQVSLRRIETLRDMLVAYGWRDLDAEGRGWLSRR